MANHSYKIQEFVAHASNVNCLNIGKKSTRLLVTGGEDQKVNLWAIGKPNSLLSLSGHTSPVESVAFDSAEVLVVSGASFGVIKLWDLEEARILRTLTGHRSSCNALQFHPFGNFFASGSSDTSLKIWDVRKKGCIHTYKGHTRGVSTIRFTPDGRWVVSGGADNVVKIWDLTAGKLLHEFKFHEGQIQCIEFHPLEFLLATGSADKTVNFWDLETFEMIGSAGPEATGVHSMTFHPDGKNLFCGLEDSLKVFAWEPIICHDSVDMGWSTLGDLNINEGKLLGCSYYHNCVGVWAADVSLFGPYAPGVPTRSNGHRQHKFGIQESQYQQDVGYTIKSNAGLLKTPLDDDTPEIRNIYVDTYGSNKVSQKGMGTINLSKVVLPLDLSKNSSPSIVEEISEMEVPRRNSQVTNKQFTVPSPTKDSSAATAVSSEREDTLTEITTPGIGLKPSHMRRSSSTLYETEKLSLPTEFESSSPSTLKNISEMEVPIRSNNQINDRQFTVPLILPRNDSTASNAASSRREVTLTQTTIPDTRLKASHMQRSSNTKYEAEKLSLPSESKTSNPSSLKHISEMEVTMRSNSQVNNRQFTVPLVVPRSDSTAANAVNTRREVTLAETTTPGTGLKPSHMRRSSNAKYETEKLLLLTGSGRFSTQVGGPIIPPDQKAHSRLLSKVESTQSVEDSHKELRSVAKKFERIPQLETPSRTSGDSGVDSQCDSKVKTSSNEVNQVQFGRTRSLVERWEKREICSTDEPLTSTTSTNVMPECHTHAHILNEKKEQPQTTGRESASINGENVLEDLMQNHDSFIGCFNSRLAKLQVVRYFWQRNDVKGGLNAVGKLPDHSVQADVVSVLVEKMDIVSLELFSCLLPILLSLLNSQIDRHTNVSLEMLLKLVAIFGSVIRLTISASPSVGVDLQAERRLECCRLCSIQLQKIKQIIPSVIRRGGLLAKYAQELHLLLQES